MALPTIVNNKYASRVTLHATANGSANVTGNSTTCDIALVNPAANTSETVNSVQIAQVWWGTSNNSNFWTIQRGANTVLILTNSGHMQFSEPGSAMTEFANAATIVFTLNGVGASGFCRVELQKQSTYDASQGA